MSTSQQRTPDWQVQVVFDPDGGGHDFAYTIGLCERSLPELHLWARPSMGDDPGADWMFSISDRTRILNTLAWRMIDGTLDVGDTWEATYDDGLATARFRLDPPGDREELEAFGIAPGALVLPVRWSLHRRPVRRAKPLTKRARERAGSEYAALLAELPLPLTPAEGWALPTSFTLGGEFGPLTPLVAGRVAEFWAADAIQLSNLLWAVMSVDAGGYLTSPVAVAAAVARDLGRVEEVARAEDAAAAVVTARLAAPDWPLLLRGLFAAIDYQPGEATLDELHKAVAHRFRQVLECVLTTEVVADGLSAAQRLEGRGAWVSGLRPIGELPGPQWRAPRRVLDQVVQLLRPLGFSELVTLACRQESDDLGDYHSVAERIQGWAIVSAAGCPWRGVLDQLPGVNPVARITRLQEWATVMTSAMCHRQRLSAADVAVICAPFLDVVPELPGLLAA